TLTERALRPVGETKITLCVPGETLTIFGVLPSGRPSTSTFETGMELMRRVAFPVGAGFEVPGKLAATGLALAAVPVACLGCDAAAGAAAALGSLLGCADSPPSPGLGASSLASSASCAGSSALGAAAATLAASGARSTRRTASSPPTTLTA